MWNPQTGYWEDIIGHVADYSTSIRKNAAGGGIWSRELRASKWVRKDRTPMRGHCTGKGYSGTDGWYELGNLDRNTQHLLKTTQVCSPFHGKGYRGTDGWYDLGNLDRNTQHLLKTTQVFSPFHATVSSLVFSRAPPSLLSATAWRPPLLTYCVIVFLFLKLCDLRQRHTCKIHVCNSGTHVMKVTSHVLKIRLKAHSVRWTPYLALVKWTRLWH